MILFLAAYGQLQMKPIKILEVQLAGWTKSDSHGRAPSVTFFLQDDEDAEFFAAYTAAKGRGKNHVAGQIFDCAISISDQDDQSQESLRKEPTRNNNKLSQWAAMRCKEPQFHRFLNIADDLNAEAIARQMILDVCGIESRAELDTNKEAADIFHEKFRLPFLDWWNK